MNDNNDFGFIPIKSKILPQYDDSNPQTENKVKPKTVSVAENTDTENIDTSETIPENNTGTTPENTDNIEPVIAQ